MLSFAGFRVRKNPRIPEHFIRDYKLNLAKLRNKPGGFIISEQLFYDVGVHPENYVDYECIFASQHVSKIKPDSILDIGSYRHFILGLLSHYQVTSVDVRERTPVSENDSVVTCDAKKLTLPDHSFDVVTSLCAIEHFGLGRYGDEFDLTADKKAFSEMIRVLKPGGHLIFTTTITNAPPSVVFNGHRIYSHEMIKEFCSGLTLVEERAFSRSAGVYCDLNEVTREPFIWDVYCGCWKKTSKIIDCHTLYAMPAARQDDFVLV